jgi:hypothetical protein
MNGFLNLEIQAGKYSYFYFGTGEMRVQGLFDVAFKDSTVGAVSAIYVGLRYGLNTTMSTNVEDGEPNWRPNIGVVWWNFRGLGVSFLP